VKYLLLFLLAGILAGCCHSKQIFFDDKGQLDRWVLGHPKVKIAWIYRENLMIETECK